MIKQKLGNLNRNGNLEGQIQKFNDRYILFDADVRHSPDGNEHWVYYPDALLSSYMNRDEFDDFLTSLHARVENIMQLKHNDHVERLVQIAVRQYGWMLEPIADAA